MDIDKKNKVEIIGADGGSGKKNKNKNTNKKPNGVASSVVPDGDNGQNNIKLESYKIIDGFESYEISDEGNVRNIITKRILKPQQYKGGYCTVKLYNDDKSISKNIHKLVARAFIENPDEKTCIDHIDNDKTNNNVNNLRFKSPVDKNYETISNKKFGMTEERIKTIEELWLINFPIMKETYKKYYDKELVYKKNLTPRLKEFYMEGYQLI